MLSIVYAFATAMVAGIIAYDALALVPADVMRAVAPTLSVLTVISAMAAGGVYKFSHFDTDWEPALVMVSIIAVLIRYIIELEGLIDGTALMALSYGVYVLTALGFWVLGFRGQ